MRNNDWLDQSSVYSKQQHTFYRWVMYPIIALFLFLGIFLAFAKKEVVIRTTAQLDASTTEKLQVPLDATIKENKLHENQSVKKGDLLVSFDIARFQAEKEQLDQENKRIEEQKKALQVLIDSLISEQNLFETDDTFGYSNQLKSLQAEKEAINYITKQSDVMRQKEQEVYIKEKEQIEKQLVIQQSEQQDWEQVRNSWNNQQNLKGVSSEITSKYYSWQTQVREASEEQKNQLKETILATIDEQISELKTEGKQLQREHEKLVEPASSTNEASSQSEKIKQTKEQLMATTKQKMIELNELQYKNEVTLKNLNEQLEKGSLRAPQNGFIHLNEEVKGQIEVPKGTLLAEIYPPIQKNVLNFTTFIPSNEATRVKPKMAVHFKLDKKGVSAETLNGILTEISETSTKTKYGNFYTAKGTLEASNKLTSRYGLTGELSFIIGKKTYWQHIKDTLLNQE